MLYIAIAMLGSGGSVGYSNLPDNLRIVQDPLVIMASALINPVLFLVAFTILIMVLCWLLPKIWPAARGVFQQLGSWLGLVKRTESTTDRLDQLRQRADAGILNPSEHRAARARLATP